MSKRDKLRQKLRNQPADGTMRDVQTRLQRYGFALARTQGSHPFSSMMILLPMEEATDDDEQDD